MGSFVAALAVWGALVALLGVLSRSARPGEAGIARLHAAAVVAGFALGAGSVALAETAALGVDSARLAAWLAFAAPMNAVAAFAAFAMLLNDAEGGVSNGVRSAGGPVAALALGLAGLGVLGLSAAAGELALLEAALLTLAAGAWLWRASLGGVDAAGAAGAAGAGDDRSGSGVRLASLWCVVVPAIALGVVALSRTAVASVAGYRSAWAVGADPLEGALTAPLLGSPISGLSAHLADVALAGAAIVCLALRDRLPSGGRLALAVGMLVGSAWRVLGSV